MADDEASITLPSNFPDSVFSRYELSTRSVAIAAGDRMIASDLLNDQLSELLRIIIIYTYLALG